MNTTTESSTARGATVVLRRLGWTAAELILCGAFAAAFLLIPAHYDPLHALTGGGAGGALLATFIAARYRCEVKDGQIIARMQLRAPQSADLTRLTSAIAPAERETFAGSVLFGRRRYLMLRDERGSEVRVSFSGTSRARRRALLAGLEPYVLADGVARDGLLTEALAGELWWPRPRPRG